VRLEGLGQLKKKHLIGTRTRTFACSIVPQPTTLPRAPQSNPYQLQFHKCPVALVPYIGDAGGKEQILLALKYGPVYALVVSQSAYNRAQ
jgi:hypothetical protein